MLGARRDSALGAFGRRIVAMSKLKEIPVVAEAARARSGEKYVTPQGFTAIRDGISAREAFETFGVL